MEKECSKGTDDIKTHTGDVTELKHWSSKFGVKRSDIARAVSEVGDSLNAVTKYFNSRR